MNKRTLESSLAFDITPPKKMIGVVRESLAGAGLVLVNTEKKVGLAIGPACLFLRNYRHDSYLLYGNQTLMYNVACYA